MLSQKVPLLESKISNLETVNANLEQVDSLRSMQLTMYKDALTGKEREIASYKQSKKLDRAITGGSVLATIILAIICALK